MVWACSYRNLEASQCPQLYRLRYTVDGKNQCLNFYICIFYVPSLYLISNSRIFVNMSRHSTEHEVHKLNVQLHYHSDKAELLSTLTILNPQYICSNCAKEPFKYYFVTGDLIIQVFSLMQLQGKYCERPFYTFIKQKVPLHFVHLEQIIQKKSAHYKDFVIILLFYSLINIS